MVVVMKERASDEQVQKVIAHLVNLGMDVHRSTGASRTVLGVVGSGKVDPGLIEMLDGVHEVLRISEPYTPVPKVLNCTSTSRPPAARMFSTRTSSNRTFETVFLSPAPIARAPQYPLG